MVYYLTLSGGIYDDVCPPPIDITIKPVLNELYEKLELNDANRLATYITQTAMFLANPNAETWKAKYYSHPGLVKATDNIVKGIVSHEGAKALPLDKASDLIESFPLHKELGSTTVAVKDSSDLTVMLLHTHNSYVMSVVPSRTSTHILEEPLLEKLSVHARVWLAMYTLNFKDISINQDTVLLVDGAPVKPAMQLNSSDVDLTIELKNLGIHHF